MDPSRLLVREHGQVSARHDFGARRPPNPACFVRLIRLGCRVAQVMLPCRDSWRIGPSPALSAAVPHSSGTVASPIRSRHQSTTGPANSHGLIESILGEQDFCIFYSTFEPKWIGFRTATEFEFVRDESSRNCGPASSRPTCPRAEREKPKAGSRTVFGSLKWPQCRYHSKKAISRSATDGIVPSFSRQRGWVSSCALRCTRSPWRSCSTVPL